MAQLHILDPYKTVDYKGIQYTVCRDFDHISRYRCLRQVIHNSNDSDRFISLETVNPFSTNVSVTYYDVPTYQENRLDLISKQFFGTSSYSWVIAYFNHIEDGFSVAAGSRISIPSVFSSLFNEGEILAPTTALQMNLGAE